mmetsp:Transcript_124546/g.398402  ORF Transcript_124546/g.398402 Transcript_124546/m.398402 type:complete len:159 (-) Transcript_124546:1001-1477(-)
MILDMSCNPMPGAIMVSNVKRLFRSELGLKLSETVLGYSKIRDLLQVARLSNICALQAVWGSSQTLVRRVEPANFSSQWAPFLRPVCFNVPLSSGKVCLSTTCVSNRAPVPTAPLLQTMHPGADSPTASSWLSTNPTDAPTASMLLVVVQEGHVRAPE